MIKHIVFWKLAEEAEGNTREQNIAIMKERLEGLVGQIPGLLSAEVGANCNGGEYDAALVATFPDMEALHAYDVHPAHQAVREFVTKVRLARVSVDYPIE